MHLLTLFFAVDGSHAKKRILAFQNNVEKVSIVSYYRSKNERYQNHYNLGRSPQKQYFRRFVKILFDVPRLIKILKQNKDVDAVYAWNFDVALIFAFANSFIKNKYVFIYEVADIKPIVLSKSPLGWILRRLEQYILNQTQYLCVTSNAFTENYFNKFYKYNSQIHLLENKVYPPLEPVQKDTDVILRGKFNIGYIGLFRCKESMQLLNMLAEKLHDKINVVLAGRPESAVKKEFDALIDQNNVSYLGEYSYPEGLTKVFQEIDIIWTGDFSDENQNSNWLLPNRIYEAGLFSVPQLGFSKNSAIAEYINNYKIGWILKEASIEELNKFFSNLSMEMFLDIKRNYSKLSSSQFSDDDQIKDLVINLKKYV